MFDSLDIYCDGCDTRYLDVFWHSTGCPWPGFDVCQDRHDKAIICKDQEHVLIQNLRIFKIGVEANEYDL